MAEHKIQYTKASGHTDLPHWGQCKCGQNSGWLATREECEDWAIQHEAQVQRALAALHRSNPSIKNQFDYYSERAADKTLSLREREQWRILADGLRPRLPVESGRDDEGQTPLF